MEIVVLGSGSSGNSYYFPFGDIYNFVDVGVARNLLRPLLSEKRPRHINIFITHEHNDHISGLRSLQRMFPTVPIFVYASTPVLNLLHNMTSLQKFWLSEFVTPHEMHPDKLYSVNMLVEGDSPCNGSVPRINVRTHRILHNSPLGLSYRFDILVPEPATITSDNLPASNTKNVDIFNKHEIYSGNENIVSVGFLSDTGDITPEMLDSYGRCRILFLEANYDDSLLEKSSYPRAVKQRIASSTGHLSNAQGLQFMEKLSVSGRVKVLVLSHVSENANSYNLLELYSDFYQSTYSIKSVVLKQKSFRKIIIK